ncbi:hypothetical protein [Pseudomonas lini]|uniref:hypothetical protein n=1 Tax=Pseudomonas lini TaxID=163011 RepID=UPI00345E9BFB
MQVLKGLPLTKSELLAVALTVDGVDRADPDGVIPPHLLTQGTIARIPRWENYSTISSRIDRLIVTWEQDGVKTVIFNQGYPGPITQLEFEVRLTPQRLAKDGVALLYYEVIDADQNADPATAIKLTIDHIQRPVPTLKPVTFPHATLWGYLNCFTRPELKRGVTVRVLPQTIGAAGDLCTMQWQGYKSLNGQNLVIGAFKELTHTLTTGDLDVGFSLEMPFDPCVRPLVNNHSALVVIRFYSGGRLIAKSEPELVKIDRTVAGSTLPCYSES